MLILVFIFILNIFAYDRTAINAKFKEAEVYIDYLTSANFTQTSTGNWLIFFGSSSCIHCKIFTPTWLDLQRYVKESKIDEFLKIGKVNCPTTHGELQLT